MHVRRKRGWELPESKATPEGVYLNRRRLLAAAGIGGGAAVLAGIGAGIGTGPAAAQADDPTADLYPVPRNAAYAAERPLTPEEIVTSYNNFYEYGPDKGIAGRAQALRIRPWTVTIDGLVEREQVLDIDTLIRSMPLEERLYRHRCVEAWSMVVPWSGFPLSALVDRARPLGSARYIRFETFQDQDAPGFSSFYYPWPYIEGLTMAEATNELAFMVTGLYGRPAPRQNGAPLRLAVPWKYGFKSIKSIVRITFTEERPVSFWEALQASEYGFWANVNPEVPHPRWSQASERDIGTGERIPTQLYNGYGPYVAHLYAGLEGEALYM